jgi:sulfate-transporting ATPase
VIVLSFAITGLVVSAVLALLGQSIIVVHRGTGVPNFSAAAIGMFGAYIFYGLWPASAIPWPLALLVAMMVSAAIGVVMHVAVMRRLRKSSMATKVTATLGLMTLLVALANQYFALDGAVRFVPSFLPAGVLTISSNLKIGYGQLILVLIAAGVSAVLILVQKRTRFGLATLAVCENETVASGMGWSPDFIAAANWAVGSVIATLAIVLLAPVSGLSTGTFAFLVVPALGAALVGNFDSFALTIIGALVIGIGQAEVGLVTLAPGWSEAAPLLVIVGALLVRGQKLQDRSEGSARRVPSVGPAHFTLSTVVVGIAGLCALFLLSGQWLDALTTTLLGAIALLSIVVLTGFAGQLSLAQYGLAGLGAFMSAVLSIRLGIPPLLSMVIAIAITVIAGLLVAVPALRTRGATLSIATVSLLVVIEDLILTNPNASTWFGTKELPALSIFGISVNALTSPRTYGVVVLVSFLIVSLLLVNLRRSATGRKLLAIRANPSAAASLGVSPSAAKMYAFAVAGAIAALCGVLTEARLAFPDFSLFTAQASINQILQLTIAGVGWVGGALVGALGVASGLFSQLLEVFFSPSNWLDVITAVGVFLVLLQSPDGIVPANVRQFHDAYRWARSKDPAWLSLRSDGRARKGREDPFARAARLGSVAVDRRRPVHVSLENLTVTYGTVKALDSVSMSVAPSEIVGLIGPNGAGKSTLIDAVCGVLRPAAGEIRMEAEPVTRLSPTKRARRGMIRSFQSLELFEDMTVSENLLVGAERPRWWRGLADLVWPSRPRPTEAALLAVRDFRLGDLLAQTPRTLDHGRRRLLAIARAFAADPAVILLDEPAAGLDGLERAELGRLLQKVAKDWHIGVLLVEHDVNLVFGICDRVVALVNGRIVSEGLPAAVRANPVVVEAYLGSGAHRRDDGAGTERPSSVTDGVSVAPVIGEGPVTP